MASVARGVPQSGAGNTAVAVIVRQDRIPICSLPYLFMAVSAFLMSPSRSSRSSPSCLPDRSSHHHTYQK